MKGLYKIFSLSLLFLFSCAGNKMSVHYIEMSTFEPAKVTFTPDIVNVVVVNNMPDAIVEPFFFEKKLAADFQVEEQDTVFVNMSRYFTSMMNDKKYFNLVDIYPDRTRKGDYDKNVRLLTDEQVVDICEATDADLLISIDKFIVDEEIETITPLSYGQPLLFYPYCQASMFYSSGEMFPQGVTMKDTLAIMASRIEKEDRKQTRDGSRRNIMLLAIDKFVSYIIPTVKREERWFYSYQNVNAGLAEEAAKAGDWAVAKEVWGEALEGETDVQLKARLAFNIALANECLDDLDGAAEYLKIAGEYLDTTGSKLLKEDFKKYQVLLDKRKSRFYELQEQLGYTDTPEENKD